MSFPRFSLVALALAAGVADVGLAQSLPSGLDGGPAVFYLEVVVNGMPTARVIPVDYREGSYFIAADDLRALSIRTDANDGDRVAVDHIPNVDVEYDGHRQRLLITVPADWLPMHAIEPRWRRPRVRAETSAGAVVNYDVQINASHGARQLSVWSEQRLFDRWGTVSSTGLYRTRADGRDRSTAYLRYDTSWRYADEDRMVTYAAGDVVTGSLPSMTAVRIGGVSISRSFSVRPDLVTHPLPQFAGRATVPSSVDLLVEGRPTVSSDVPPGPFVVNDVPLITGAGTATIVTTDALGRQIATDVSFYVANTLLRKGLLDYSVSGGFVRRGFGVRSMAYGNPVASGMLRYGATNDLSVAAHVEGGPGQLTAGGGADVKIGVLGVAGASLSESRHANQSGRQISIAYSYNARSFGFSARHVHRSSGFADLSVHDRPDGGIEPRRSLRLSQLTAAIQLGRRIGTLGAGAFRDRDAGGDHRTVISVSYHRPLFAGSNLHASMHERTGTERRERTAQIQVTFSLGGRGSIATRAVRRRAEESGVGLHYRRTAPLAGGLGWNVGYSSGTGDVRHADVAWRSRYAEVQGGFREHVAGRAGWASVSGAAIVMGGAAFATSRVADAFVLIDTNGQEGVPVRYEHQVVGTTNRRGHLMVPWAAAYYAASYQIDPLALDADVRTPVVEQRVAVRRNSGLVVKFPLQRVASVLFVLVDEVGQPLQVGSAVRHEHTGETTIVGWDGLVYLEGVRSSNRLHVTTPRGGECIAAFDFEATHGQVARLGPIPCR